MIKSQRLRAKILKSAEEIYRQIYTRVQDDRLFRLHHCSMLKHDRTHGTVSAVTRHSVVAYSDIRVSSERPAPLPRHAVRVTPIDGLAETHSKCETATERTGISYKLSQLDRGRRENCVYGRDWRSTPTVFARVEARHCHAYISQLVRGRFYDIDQTCRCLMHCVHVYVNPRRI